MRHRNLVVCAALIFAVLAPAAAMACHSNYFNECFVKLNRMKKDGSLTKSQIVDLWKLHAGFSKVQKQYNREGKPSSALDPHVEKFVAAAAGILDSKQYTLVTGKKKTEVQELRYEVNQLRKEIQELRELLKNVQPKK